MIRRFTVDLPAIEAERLKALSDAPDGRRGGPRGEVTMAQKGDNLVVTEWTRAGIDGFLMTTRGTASWSGAHKLDVVIKNHHWWRPHLLIVVGLLLCVGTLWRGTVSLLLGVAFVGIGLLLRQSKASLNADLDAVEAVFRAEVAGTWAATGDDRPAPEDASSDT